MVEQFARTLAAGPAVVVFQHLLELGFVGLVAVPGGTRHGGHLLVAGQDAFERDHGQVAAGVELAVFVVHVGHAAAHAGGEVASGLAQHHHGAAGHVFAAMVARAFDDGGGTRQAHGKALTGDAAESRPRRWWHRT